MFRFIKVVFLFHKERGKIKPIVKPEDSGRIKICPIKKGLRRGSWDMRVGVIHDSVVK